MEKILNYLKKNKITIFFILSNLCFFGVFVLNHFANDTYFLQYNGYMENFKIYLKDGRWLMCLFLYICNILNLSFRTAKVLSWGLAILSLSFSSKILYDILEKRVKKDYNKVFIFLLSFMAISNIFVLEYFIFAEFTGIMCFGILLGLITVKYIVEYIESKKIKYYIIGIVIAIISILCYQGTFGTAVVILVILLSKEIFKNVKAFIKNNLIIGSIYIVPAIFAVIIAKFFDTQKSFNTEFNIIDSLSSVLVGVKNLFIDTSQFLPKYLYISIVGILILFVIYKIISEKKIKLSLSFIYYAVITLLAIIAPHLLLSPASVWIVPRSAYIMGSLVPIIVIAIMLNFNVKKREYIIISCIVAVLMLFQYIGINRISTNHYASNKIDLYEVNLIKEQILLYEEETGEKVKNLAVYKDEETVISSPGILNTGDINIRILSIDWAFVDAINILADLNLQKVQNSSEVYENCFEDRNWSSFNTEQLVFVGDTLHICIY